MKFSNGIKRKEFLIFKKTPTLFPHTEFLYFTLLIFFFAANTGNSQNSKRKTFEHLNPDQGMNSYIAPCIIQDRTGYLWFGTYNGLDR